MELRFTIQGRLAGSNEIKYADRSHWSKGAKLRKADLERCTWSIGMQNIIQHARFTNAVGVNFAWIEPNGKRDLDNIMGGQKAILDALVLCAIIPNDTRKWVKSLTHTFPDPDAKNPRIEIVIDEIACAGESVEPFRGLSNI